jgi:hypothetical protein
VAGDGITAGAGTGHRGSLFWGVAGRGPFSEGLRRYVPPVAQFGVPFAVVCYLGLQGGGYDLVTYGQVGILVWWLVLLGAMDGLLPVAPPGRAAKALLAVLLALGLWTLLGLLWTDSDEQTVREVARVATYVGLFAIALSIQGTEGLRRAIYGVATAIVVVGLVALLSRLEPSWFPDRGVTELVPDSKSRLHYPLDYWNGLAALSAIGVPLLLAMATRARAAPIRGLGAAAIPALALTGYFTQSRGGAIVAVVGVALLIALHPNRPRLLATTLIAGTGGAILVALASSRDDLVDGLTSSTASSQGDQMLIFTLVVCAAVGIAASLIPVSFAARERRAPILFPRGWLGVGGAAALVALVIAIAAGAPGELSDSWDRFKEPDIQTGTERFTSTGGSGRWQYWGTAVDEWQSEPVVGTGPGTYQFFWAEHGPIPGFVRDAHSLYLEELGELGPIGFLLVLALIGGVIAVGVGRTLAAAEEERELLAAATAACLAFGVGAAIDWLWELAALSATFLILAATIAARPSPREAPAGDGLGLRIWLGIAAVGSIVAVLIPLAATSAVSSSEDDVRAGDLSGALEHARDAAKIEPYAATPRLQEALVLERSGQLDEAAAAATEATDKEPTNWRTWLVLSRVEAERGNTEQSVAAYRKARSLNPRSPLFAGPAPQ